MCNSFTVIITVPLWLLLLLLLPDACADARRTFDRPTAMSELGTWAGSAAIRAILLSRVVGVSLNNFLEHTSKEVLHYREAFSNTAAQASSLSTGGSNAPSAVTCGCTMTAAVAFPYF
jgi:hypothetical protein